MNPFTAGLIGFAAGTLFIVMVFYSNAYSSIEKNPEITLSTWYGISIPEKNTYIIEE